MKSLQLQFFFPSFVRSIFISYSFYFHFFLILSFSFFIILFSFFLTSLFFLFFLIHFFFILFLKMFFLSRDNLFTFFWIFLNVSSSISIILLNKFLSISCSCAYAITLTSMHFFCGWAFTNIVRILGFSDFQSPPPEKSLTFKEIFQLSALGSLSVCSMNF